MSPRKSGPKGRRPQHGVGRALDPALDAFAEAFFMRLLQAHLDRGAGLGLVVLRSTRYDEILGARGEAVAARVMSQLVEVLRLHLAPGDALGRIGPDELALLCLGDLSCAQQTAERLHQLVRAAIRFPVGTGAAHLGGLKGGTDALITLARKAARQSAEAGGRHSRTLTARGTAPLPKALPAEQAAPADSSLSDSLAARYQRLVLLNRMSLELFSEKPFAEAMGSACGIIAGLMGAKYVSVYFCDNFGKPFLAFRHGDGAFAGPEAQGEEAEMLSRTLKERAILTSEKTRLGWMTAPILRYWKGGPNLEDGAFLVGYEEAQPRSAEREQTLLDVSRLLRSARLTQKNLEQQKTMAAVAEQSADAIFLTDLESRIVSWNSSAQDLFQYAKEEIVGKPASLLVPKDKLEEHRKLEEEALRRGYVKNFETVRQRKDAGLVPVEGTITVLKDEAGRPFGTVKVYRDITRRKEIDRMKTEFVSLVSHELRTPLTAIRGFAETIFDFWEELTTDQRRHYLGIILEEAKRLGNLVTNFLDISRLEAGGVELHPQELDMKGLARKVASLFRDHPSKARFEQRVLPGGEKAWGDEDQVYRVLVNLCGNALKYSPPGGTITLSSRPEGRFVELGVSDQGPGIPRKHQQRIFQKFYRVADPVSMKTPGTGLGLAICESIVSAHGGRIWVESEPGKGTAFKFTLPKEAAGA